MAARQGIEPQSPEPKSGVMPLDQRALVFDEQGKQLDRVIARQLEAAAGTVSGLGRFRLANRLWRLEKVMRKRIGTVTGILHEKCGGDGPHSVWFSTTEETYVADCEGCDEEFAVPLSEVPPEIRQAWESK